MSAPEAVQGLRWYYVRSSGLLTQWDIGIPLVNGRVILIIPLKSLAHNPDFLCF